MRTFYRCILLALALQAFYVNPGSAQSKNLRRAMEMRGSDSAWVYEPFLGRTRYFWGNEQVTPLEFYNRIADSDAEVAALMQAAQRRMHTAGLLNYTGGGLGLVGLLLYNPDQMASPSPRNNIAVVLMASGIGIEIAGYVLSAAAMRTYRQGIQLFNFKARRNNFRKAQRGLQLGTGSNGVGLLLKW
jgi:hypothetical protein